MLHREYAGYPMDVRDGVKVILPGGWFLVRRLKYGTDHPRDRRSRT
jgi:hypothetical protein